MHWLQLHDSKSIKYIAIERGEDVSNWVEDEEEGAKKKKVGGKDVSVLYADDDKSATEKGGQGNESKEDEAEPEPKSDTKGDETAPLAPLLCPASARLDNGDETATVAACAIGTDTTSSTPKALQNKLHAFKRCKMQQKICERLCICNVIEQRNVQQSATYMYLHWGIIGAVLVRAEQFIQSLFRFAVNPLVLDEEDQVLDTRCGAWSSSPPLLADAFIDSSFVGLICC